MSGAVAACSGATRFSTYAGSDLAPAESSDLSDHEGLSNQGHSSPAIESVVNGALECGPGIYPAGSNRKRTVGIAPVLVGQHLVSRCCRASRYAVFEKFGSGQKAPTDCTLHFTNRAACIPPQEHSNLTPDRNKMRQQRSPIA